MRANAAWLAGQSCTTVITASSKCGWIWWVINRSSQSSRGRPTGSICTSPSAARSAVSISGAADMPATISAISPMGTLMP
ncbi:hypothetical protein G6F32_016859 [Rhizopus arrhizus]|nr:hypothetical protein G6F32_016859 [Rhizopus arrhizus]